MEGQISIGDQNSQQITQNSIEQPMSVQKTPKINYWVISAVFFIVILILVFIYFLLNKKQSSYLEVQKITPTPVATSPQVSVEPISIETIKLESASLGDPTTELFFAENDSMYSVKSDGLIRQLFKADGIVTRMTFLPGKNDVYFVTEKPEITEYYDQSTGKMSPITDPHAVSWVLKRDPQKIDKFVVPADYYMPDFGDMTRFENIYTKEGDSGGAEIILDRLDGSQPTKIGFLKEKLLETACEFTNCTKEKYHPHLFVSSFNGSFLLNAHPRGGGLGEQGIVISRDGSKIYKIDFYWYVSSAVWIDNNKLLSRDDKGSKLFIFNDNGTFETINIPNDIGNQFAQNTLSPDKKHLASLSYNVGPDNDYEISLFDTTTFEKKSVELIKFRTVDPNDMRVIGWNKDSSKLLYVVGNEVKIYDVNLGKNNVVATFKNWPPEWAGGMGKADVNRTRIFEIR
jgi:hypothetical protein